MTSHFTQEDVNRLLGPPPTSRDRLLEGDVPPELRAACAFNAVADELRRAQAKFPPFHSAHEGWATLFEEVDELWDEVKANSRSRQIHEAIQVAAMAVRFLADLPADGT